MYSYEGSVEQVQPIKFKGEQREKLVKYLDDEHERAFQTRESMIAKWKAWVEQANSRLKRDDAGPRDSNLDMTLTRERMFQSSARLQTPIFQQDQIMVARPRTSGPESQLLAQSVEDVIDFTLDRADMMTLCDDWVEQFQVFPYGVVKTPFVHQVKYVKRWDEVGPEEYDMAKELGEGKIVKREFKDGTARYYQEVEEKKIVRAGAFPFVVPAEDFIFQDSVSPDDSPWVTHRFYLSKNHIAYRIKAGVYDEKTPDGDDVLEVLGAPTSDHKPILGVHDEIKDDDSAAGKKYEILETYLCFDVDKDGYDEEIIVTWKRNSGVILRAVHNFYHEYHRPFVVHQYKHVNGSMYGIPLTFFLEPLHRAYSASVNQRLDAASKANEVAIFVPPGHPILQQYDRSSIRGGIYENPGYSKDELIEFRLSQPFTQLPQLEQLFEQRADRISHLAPESFGQQTQDRPTATGTMQVLEEGKQPQYLQLERFRKSFAEVVKHMLARYRQFYPEGLIYYIQQESPEGVQLVEQFFQWPAGSIEDDVVIETKVSSATMSKVARKQEVVALLDKMPQIYQVMMGMAQMAAQPGNPMSIIAAKILSGFQTAVDKFMREFEIGEKDALNPSLIGEVQVVQQIQQMLAQLQQQNQQLQQQNQQLQMRGAQQDQFIQAAMGGLAGPPQQPPGMAGPPGMGGPGA